ncbi:MAG: hypothetical protein JNM40_02190 [Myxococcales bacterium]|nr:hypothetical protein [Myxococcales bacterium]
MHTSSEQAIRAYALRVEQGMTYRQVGSALGVSSTAAFNWVKGVAESLAVDYKEQAAAVRQIELDRLDSIACNLLSRLPTATPEQAAKIAVSFIRVSESQRKLLGLDEPKQVELTGGVLYAVKEASPDCEAWSKPHAAGPDFTTMKPA